ETRLSVNETGSPNRPATSSQVSAPGWIARSIQPSRRPCCGLSMRLWGFGSKRMAPLRPLSPLPAGLISGAPSSLSTMWGRAAAILKGGTVFGQGVQRRHSLVVAAGDGSTWALPALREAGPAMQSRPQQRPLAHQAGLSQFPSQASEPWRDLRRDNDVRVASGFFRFAPGSGVGDAAPL